MVNVRRDNDPFKKYWWVLLVGFGLTGLWVLIPLMGQTGSSRVAVPKPQAVDQSLQSLDATENLSGAQGSAIDLSMDGVLHKSRSSETATSSLYEAPEGGAEGAPILDAKSIPSTKNLASALKAVSKSDPAGWGGEKAQRGFTSSKGSFKGMASLGGGGGSGASMSASPFNKGGPEVSIQDSGAGGSESGSAAGGRAYMRSVRNAAAQSVAASKLAGDASKAGSAGSFDGSGASGKTIGSAGKGIVFGQFDSGMAPANLKMKKGGAFMDPDKKPDDALEKIADAISGMKGKEVKDDYKEQMGDQMGQMVMSLVVGGVVGGMVEGPAAAAVTSFAMQSTQMLMKSNMK
jgi:hypothetical protein